MKNRCLKWGIHFDLANKKLRVEEIEGIMEEPNFWDSMTPTMLESTTLEPTAKSNRPITTMK